MTVRRALASALILVLIWYLSPMVFRRFTDSVLFYPEQGQWRTPAALGLSFEEVWLDASGDRVQAWWVAGEATGAVIVMFHGNAGTIADRLENVAALVSRLGVSVFQVEYPGYGDSGGRPSEQSLYAAGEAGLREARRRAGDRKLVVFGRSLGGAVAIDVATRHSVDGLIAESTFTSLPDMAASSGIPLARYLVAYRFDCLAKIGQVGAPLLLLHGNRDEVVPYPMAARLFEAAARASRKSLHTVEGGAHNDTWVVGGEAYWKAWSEFLRSIADTREP
ncbi:MAG: alpha/beta hydrolase [Acidobacteria bacterium]|nr:alpha/beta hydrolase [Acidobacteriota bacterium]